MAVLVISAPTTGTMATGTVSAEYEANSYGEPEIVAHVGHLGALRMTPDEAAELTIALGVALTYVPGAGPSEERREPSSGMDVER